MTELEKFNRLLLAHVAIVGVEGDPDNKGLRVVPGPLSQQRIAERVGASKAMVNRLLSDLAEGGYIEVSRERIVLLRKLPPKW